MSRASLADLTAFAAVARHRSFRQAADALGVSRSTLSHTVIGLERNLGVRLLNRTTRSVSTTEAGERLLQRLEPLLGEIDEVIDTAAGDGGAVGGRLRINSGPEAAELLLQTVVPQFTERFPAVDLEIATDGRLVDIVKDGFDAGVRLREAVPQDMIAVPFGGPVRFLAVASPDYLARHGVPTAPGDLARHRCIRQRLPSGRSYRWEFARHGEEIAVDVPGTLTLDHNRLMAESAARGLGIAFMPESVASSALMSGDLVSVLEDWCPPFPGLCLYYPGRRHVPAALRAFVDMLRAVDTKGRTASTFD
ncbi:LysR family transcriptional regulator [Aurantimonas coralicida]|uniref:LysR family transcriptional regulator n=1 Tax=Aurantimonas coralicida TaxID=182270 RepID=UPI001E3D1C55|nr:LysR family transcriptional regulator [Aurantimonas coralicida]MCD1642895.1 LysR family transcriptional regulator [Aurantimonas coralicida]